MTILSVLTVLLLAGTANAQCVGRHLLTGMQVAVVESFGATQGNAYP